MCRVNTNINIKQPAKTAESLLMDSYHNRLSLSLFSPCTWSTQNGCGVLYLCCWYVVAMCQQLTSIIMNDTLSLPPAVKKKMKPKYPGYECCHLMISWLPIKTSFMTLFVARDCAGAADQLNHGLKFPPIVPQSSPA